MGTQGTGRKRHPNRERLSAEDHALNQIAREAEARLAAKRAARAEAREIRMKELERQQKEIYQVQKKYYGLDAKWGDIEQWMASDDDDLMSVTSRSSLRTNGYEDELLGPSQYRKSSRSSTGSGETYQSSRGAPRDETMSAYYSDLSLASAPLSSKQQQQSVHNGSRPSLLNCNSLPSRSQRGSLYDEGVSSSSRRSSSSRPPSEYSCYLGSGSRASSRASSARASPVSSEPPGPSVYRRGSNSASIPSLSHLDDVSVPSMSRVEERSDKDFGEKGSRPVSSLSAATLASLGGTSSRRGSGDTSISVDTEASIREIKEISELKEQIEDVEGRYMQGLKEMKDSLAEVEEKYKRSMVTNAQLDNEKTSLQYQVDTLREVLLELEEELAESRRQYEDKHKECERQRHDQNVLRFQLAEMKEALEQRESLLAKHGIALDSVGTPNGDASLEPHVNADGRPDPPIRATSMGPSEKAVEKKEMSVVSESSPSKPKQDNQEVLLTVASETPLNAEHGDKAEEENIQEISSNSNEDVDSHKIARSNDDVHAGGCQNLEHQGEGLPPDSESTSKENEKAVDECASPNLNSEDLEQNVSEVHIEANPDQGVSSPVESEVFQDALDNIVLSPCATSPPSNQLEACIGDFENDTSKQDFSKEEERYEVQSTSVENESDPNSGSMEISECRDHTAITTDDTSDLHTDTTDGQESSINDSIQFKLEERSADEMTATPVEHESVCEDVVKPEKQIPVPAESGLQCRKDASDINNSNANYEFSEKELISTETALHTNIHDVVEEKNTDVTPEQSSQDTQLAKEETQLVDSENNNCSEVPEDPEPCIAWSTQSTVESEPQRDSDFFEDSVSHLDQHENIADAGSLKADQKAAEALDIGEQDTLSDKSEKTIEKPKSPDAPDEGKPDTFSDNPVCIKIENMNENINPVLLDVSSTEFLDDKKLEKTSDLPNKNENTNDNVTDVTETQKETVSSETFSEGASTPEGEESDDNDDNEDDVAVRSEKYTGESLPLGSSVDQTSADDIRMEDSADKASRRGKGKNKEDCVVS